MVGLRGPAFPLVLVLVSISLAGSRSLAQEADDGAGEVDPEMFEKQSVALRTALFHDPSLEAPLKSLAKLYRSAERGDELLSIYRSHTSQYPQDESSRVVFIRLLREMGKPEARNLVTTARKDFPNSALIAYLSSDRMHEVNQAIAFALGLDAHTFGL